MKLRINEKEIPMKYKTYGNIEKCFNILVNEKGYSKEEAQDIIDNVLADYKYNPNSTDSLLRRINLVLPKDEYEKEYGIAERYTKLKEKEASNIEVKHEGILEVPEGKNVNDLPLSHFVNLANKKGLSKITKALNNLQVWNKNDNPKLSKWAGDMIDKLNKKLKKDESLKKLNETNAIVIDIPKQEYDFHFKGTDKDGWKRDVHKVIVKYNNKGYFVDLILIDDNGVKVNSARKKFKFVGKDVVITDADRNDIVIGHIVDNRNESLKLKDESVSVKDIRAITNSDRAMDFLTKIQETERNLSNFTPYERKSALRNTRKYVKYINDEIKDTLPIMQQEEDEYNNYFLQNDSNESLTIKEHIFESGDFDKYKDKSLSIKDIDIAHLEKFIHKKLHEYSLWPEDLLVSKDYEYITIEVQIDWGDWKHEHKRLDYVMYDIIYEYNPELASNFYKEKEEVTDEDGSDTYSAKHIYRIIE